MNRRRQVNKPEYTLKKVKLAIKEGRYLLTSKARRTMNDHFSWTTTEMEKAFLSLNLGHFHISVNRNHEPKGKQGPPPTILDIYHGNGLLGEDVYTHFYFDGELMVIDSLHQLNKQK